MLVMELSVSSSSIGNSLKIIVITQFLTSHNPIIACKEGHAWLASNRPFLHAAVGFTGVVDKTSN